MGTVCGTRSWNALGRGQMLIHGATWAALTVLFVSVRRFSVYSECESFGSCNVTSGLSSPVILSRWCLQPPGFLVSGWPRHSCVPLWQVLLMFHLGNLCPLESGRYFHFVFWKLCRLACRA